MTAPSLPGTPPQTTSSVCQEFESVWKQFVAGPPRLEDYLARLLPTEQAHAAETLRQIERRFRPLLEVRSPAPPLGETVDHHPAAAAPTGDIPGIGTVDGSQGAASAASTVDEASGRPIPSRTVGKLPALPGYVVLGELGHGGMGVVYKAHHLALNRMVALKMIKSGADVDEAQRTRFTIEAQAVAKLQHPAVVQVFEISEHDGLPFFSLEYVAGGSLESKVRRNPQPPTDAARMVATIARAVQAAHEQGIIHRDLKPSNVLLTPEGAPKITDFGLARRLEGDTGKTRSGSILGSPNYMAPEQARGEVESVGPLADVYALGGILYEMLTGRPPFQGSTVLEVLEQVRNNEPVPPQRLLPRLPRDLDTICLKCLQKMPARRYPSAAALADDLDRYLEGRPITARPVSNVERLWRLCRRNPVVSGLTVVLSLLLLAAAIGGPSIAVWISRERDKALFARNEETKPRTGRRLRAARRTMTSRQHRTHCAVSYWCFRTARRTSRNSRRCVSD